MSDKTQTLDEFTMQDVKKFPDATGQLSSLLRDIGLASKRINVEVNKAGLADVLGDTGSQNVQGEIVKKLDDLANKHLVSALKNGIGCAGIASEEVEDVIIFEEQANIKSKYVVMFDPLDGSSNIDNNISIGTIFCVYRRVSEPGYKCVIEDFLQTGASIIAAGYIIYGSSTMLVYATRMGVNGFTLDLSIGEFCLSHPNIKCPPDGKIYSVNESNISGFSGIVQKYITRLKDCNAKNEGTYSSRYVGSMVADLHRNLLNGGIFLYPATAKYPGGKLRLMYECMPFAYIYSMAGGIATDGFQNILDIRPQQLHQRTPIFIGSKNMVEELAILPVKK